MHECIHTGEYLIVATIEGLIEGHAIERVPHVQPSVQQAPTQTRNASFDLRPAPQVCMCV